MTQKILQDFTCPPDTMPYSAKKRAHYTRALEAITPKIEQLTADAAASEQKALGVLELPNLKNVSKDTAHAMRRVASRSTFADPFLKHVLLGETS